MGVALLLNIMALSIENKYRFKCHRLNYWPKFKIISHKCYEYCLLPKKVHEICLGETFAAKVKIQLF